MQFVLPTPSSGTKHVATTISRSSNNANLDPKTYLITHNEVDQLTTKQNNVSLFAGIESMAPIFSKINKFKNDVLKDTFSHEIDMKKKNIILYI